MLVRVLFSYDSISFPPTSVQKKKEAKVTETATPTGAGKVTLQHKFRQQDDPLLGGAGGPAAKRRVGFAVAAVSDDAGDAGEGEDAYEEPDFSNVKPPAGITVSGFVPSRSVVFDMIVCLFHAVHVGSFGYSL